MKDKNEKLALIDEYKDPRLRKQPQKDHGALDVADLAVKVFTALEVRQIRNGIQDQARAMEKNVEAAERHNVAMAELVADRNHLQKSQDNAQRKFAAEKSGLIRLQKRQLARQERREREAQDRKRISEIMKHSLGIHLRQYGDVLRIAREQTLSMVEAAAMWRERMHRLDLEFLLPNDPRNDRDELLESLGVHAGFTRLGALYPQFVVASSCIQQFDLEGAVQESLDSDIPLRTLIDTRLVDFEKRIVRERDMAISELAHIHRIQMTEVIPAYAKKVEQARKDLILFRAEMELEALEWAGLKIFLLVMGGICIAIVFQSYLKQIEFSRMALVTGGIILCVMGSWTAIKWLVQRKKASNESLARPFRQEVVDFTQKYPAISPRTLFDQGGHAWFQIKGTPAHKGLDLLCAKKNMLFTHNDAIGFRDLYSRWKDASGDLREGLASLLFLSMDEGLRNGDPVASVLNDNNASELKPAIDLTNSTKNEAEHAGK